MFSSRVNMSEKEFVKSCILQIPEFILKKFPAEFIGNATTRKMKMPGRSLILGSELFGTYEIINAEGSVEFHVPSLAEAKYILYANRTHSKEIEIPIDEVEVEKAVKNYEKHLDSILTTIEEDFKRHLPKSKGFHRVSNQVFKSLNLIRF
jgi:hypothetical protein